MENKNLEVFKQWHQSMSEKLSDVEMLINYQGIFEEELIHGLTDVIEKKIIHLKYSFNTAQRVFASISETLMNINAYATSEITRNGSIFLYRKEKKFYIVVSNIVDNSNKERLKSRILNINELNRDELKSRYLELKKRSIISNSGGLGVGLVFIRMCSSGSVNFQFEELNAEQSIFTLSYKV